MYDVGGRAGYGVNTFVLVNGEGKETYVKVPPPCCTTRCCGHKLVVHGWLYIYRIRRKCSFRSGFR